MYHIRISDIITQELKNMQSRVWSPRWHGDKAGLSIQGSWVRIQHCPHLKKGSFGKVLTQIVPLSTKDYKWVPACGCTLLYAVKHGDQGVRCEVG